MTQNASADVQHTANWLAFPKTHSTVRVSMRPLALPVESTLTSSPHPLTSSLFPHSLTFSPHLLTPILTGTCYSPERSTHGDCLWPSQNRYKPSWCLPQYIFIHAHTLTHVLPHPHTPHPHTLTLLTLGTRLCLHVTRAKKSVLNLSIYLLI